MVEKLAANKLENGLLTLEIEQTDNPISNLLSKSLADQTFFVALNLRAIGREPEELELADLFADIAEIRAENSMSMVGPEDVNELVELMAPFIQHDCGILLVPKVPATEFSNEINLYLPWLLKPSLFDFNFRNSPEYLPSQVFAVIEFAIYFLPAQKSWIIMSLNPDIEQIFDVGLRPWFQVPGEIDTSLKMVAKKPNGENDQST